MPILEQDRRIVPVDIFAFGGSQGPRVPRSKDLPPGLSGEVGPEGGSTPRGASTFGDPERAELSGHYHRLAAGTRLPEGIEVIADGQDVLPDSEHLPTHHTIYPSVVMTFERFVELYLGLPWEYGGKRRVE